MPTESPIFHASPHQHLKVSCMLLRDYATLMLDSGATARRIEQSVRRIATAWGIKADISILPQRVLLALWDRTEQHSYTCVGHKSSLGINLGTMARLNRLSYIIEERHLSPAMAEACMKRIAGMPGWDARLVLLLVSCANASFCRLFGGDASAMGIVFLATLLGFHIKQRFLKHHIDPRLTTLFSAFSAAVTSTAGYVFGCTHTPEIAVGTSVLFLVPGIPFANGASDMLSRHYVCALSRLTDALVTTFCLSTGLCAALYITGFQW